MKKLASNQMSALQGGVIECVHVTGDRITFYLFTDESGWGNGFLLASPFAPNIECHVLPNP